MNSSQKKNCQVCVTRCISEFRVCPNFFLSSLFFFPIFHLGRTMEFTFDLSQTPLIGRRQVNKTDEKDGNAPSTSTSSTISSSGVTGSAGGVSTTANTSAASSAATVALSALPGPAHTSSITLGNTALSPRRSVSLSPAESTNIAGWKRPWMSQVLTCSNKFSCNV